MPRSFWHPTRFPTLWAPYQELRPFVTDSSRNGLLWLCYWRCSGSRTQRWMAFCCLSISNNDVSWAELSDSRTRAPCSYLRLEEVEALSIRHGDNCLHWSFVSSHLGNQSRTLSKKSSLAWTPLWVSCEDHPHERTTEHYCRCFITTWRSATNQFRLTSGKQGNVWHHSKLSRQALLRHILLLLWFLCDDAPYSLVYYALVLSWSAIEVTLLHSRRGKAPLHTTRAWIDQIDYALDPRCPIFCLLWIRQSPWWHQKSVVLAEDEKRYWTLHQDLLSLPSE